MPIELSSSDMVEIFKNITTDLMGIHFPMKRISISPCDKPWMTEGPQSLGRRCQKLYRKEGRSTEKLKFKQESAEIEI